MLAVQRFTWATKASPNPRLATPISSTALTIPVTAAPTDEDGGAITGNFQMGIRNRDTGYIEFVWVAAAEASGTTITLGAVTQRGCARAGINGIDWIAGVAGNRSDHPADSEVFCPATSLDFEQLFDCQQGAIASGANLWKVGDGTNSDIYWYAYNADGNKPYFKYDASSNIFVVANDGVTEVSLASGGIQTADGGCQIAGANLSIDLAAGNDLLKITGTELDTNLTATKTEIDQLASTTNIAEANTFFGATDMSGAEAETLTDTSDADALHTHATVQITRKFDAQTVNVSASTDAEVIAHGLGGTPNWVRLFATMENTSQVANGPSNISSMGMSDGAADDSCVYTGAEDSGGNDVEKAGSSSAKSIYLAYVDNNSGETIQCVATFDATNLTLTFTNSDAAAHNIYVQWEVGY